MEHTQDFSKIVVPITSVKITPSVKLGISGKLGPKPELGLYAGFGTGFCLDAACRFIATNYHVAMATQAHKIKREKIVQRYLATGPHDEGATANYVPNVGVLPYARRRDLAIFELLRPLPHHHGLGFSLDDLEVGQEVDIYAYPLEGINPFRKLLRFPGTFKGKTATGVLVFDYELSGDKAIRPGASGGIVVDSKTDQIVGVLTGVGDSAALTALAVPVQTLAEFVSKVQPFLAQKLFPSAVEVSPVPGDLYPKFIPAYADALEHRPEEPVEVKVLREKAQLLADNMRNFIAVETFAWGSGDREPAAFAAYEVQVVDGYQQFRDYPDGTKEVGDPHGHLPFPALNISVVSADEWSLLPKMVGTALRLKIRQFPDTVVNERRIKVFQYRAESEDDLCSFVSVLNFGFFKVNKTVTVSCYGEVWTDEDTNILRISEHFELPSKWGTYEAVVTYGWLRQTDEAPRLIPLTISAQSEYKKKVLWCRGQFTNYRVFSSRVKFIGN